VLGKAIDLGLDYRETKSIGSVSSRDEVHEQVFDLRFNLGAEDQLDL
jgi:hypothetical protein